MIVLNALGVPGDASGRGDRHLRGHDQLSRLPDRRGERRRGHDPLGTGRHPRLL
ncbi:MAG: hypothetical protein MZV65_29060 [Chromatiales bacterium]|nr:hypothetical protein [Chromatiales bacterium]